VNLKSTPCAFGALDSWLIFSYRRATISLKIFYAVEIAGIFSSNDAPLPPQEINQEINEAALPAPEHPHDPQGVKNAPDGYAAERHAPAPNDLRARRVRRARK